jgi:hypothetical protein
MNKEVILKQRALDKYNAMRVTQRAELREMLPKRHQSSVYDDGDIRHNFVCIYTKIQQIRVTDLIFKSIDSFNVFSD